ncbi:MAG: RHS repeat-associated core domain-containing protein, partial [Acidobacteriota bacterium]|nr:RHS repeat-associated core domain-containing protein [Acidobacteriota bacterium]
LGSRRVQADDLGRVEETYPSLPFGEMLPQNNSAFLGATEQHFAGKERDTESGNDYFGARYYNSNTGRWLSPDWSAAENPVPYAKLGDPQSLNLYAYVGNNPLGGIDQDGHDYMSLVGDTVDAMMKGAEGVFSATLDAAARQQAAAAAQQQAASVAARQLTNIKIAREALPPVQTNVMSLWRTRSLRRVSKFLKCPKGVSEVFLELPEIRRLKSGQLCPFRAGSAPDSVANARPGDVIAVGHNYDAEGHVGIVVSRDGLRLQMQTHRPPA